MSYAFTVAGRKFSLEREDVEAAVADQLPEPLREHFVVVNALRWPPKQVLEAVTGVDRADFTTHQARRILSRLGLVAGRRPRRSERLEPPERQPSERARRQGEALRPFMGKWVALGEPDEVLVAAETPQEVIAWVMSHDVTAHGGMFRVPVPGETWEIIGPID